MASAADTAPARTREPAPGRTVADLLDDFTLAKPEDRNPADVERERRVDALVIDSRDYANRIATLSEGHADEKSVKSALVSLKTARERAIKAIRSIPDEAIVGADSTELDLEQ